MKTKIVIPIMWIIRIVIIVLMLLCIFKIDSTIAYLTDMSTSTCEFSINTGYTITFDANTGTGTMDNQIIPYDVETNLSINTFTKTDLVFIGWNTNADGTGTSYTDEQIVNNIGDITLYAQWGYNIFYELDGGIISGEQNPTTYNSNTPSFTLKNPSKTGYRFRGWSGTGLRGYENTSVEIIQGSSGNRTYTANWAQTYIVNFLRNDGGVAFVKQQTMTYDVPCNLLPNTFRRTGYTFKEWNTKSNGSGIVYENRQEVVNLVIGSQLSLFAQWIPNTYYVNFDANGGEGSMENQEMVYDTASNLPANSFTKEGYVFTGWNTQADGSGTTYTDGEEVCNLTDTNGATFNLYAQWESMPTKYAVQIYGINQDVDSSGNTLGLTFGPAVGANYNNAYVTHEYEDNGDGTYNVIIITHNVEEDGTETTTSANLTNSSGNNVTRTAAQVSERENISLHNMTWAEISEVSDKTVFEDCMLCGDTKSVSLTLNNTIKTTSTYNQYGDGAGILLNTINAYYRRWNPSQSQNSYVGTGVTLDSSEINNGSNARNAGGYSTSHIRATLVGENSKTNQGYAGDVNLTEDTCLYSCIESDLRAVITPKKVKYVTGTGASDYTLNDDIADSIWLFSEREVYSTGSSSGNTTEGLGAIGEGYNKFSNTESKYYMSSYNTSRSTNRTAYYESGSTGDWWLRTPKLSNTYNVRYVKNDEGISSDEISNHMPYYGDGLTFGFCIE